LVGQRHGADTGLTDLNARWYDPVLGLFVNPDDFDPIDAKTAVGGGATGWLANPVGTNRYAYAGNDRVNKADPNGHVVQIIYAVAYTRVIVAGLLTTWWTNTEDGKAQIQSIEKAITGVSPPAGVGAFGQRLAENRIANSNTVEMRAPGMPGPQHGYVPLRIGTAGRSKIPAGAGMGFLTKMEMFGYRLAKDRLDTRGSLSRKEER